ncbi:hypothetical protein RND71_027335 [Anisodus tanguticus]|uniref:Peptidase M14 domain-containing protein n=1 Tax=Anisodus tanguticus TaxID=243964 RepID=A0AAE1V1N2_9SOLA|nr:hypothetical protein RND71_027335 [Anisodus tanguticus]
MGLFRRRRRLYFSPTSPLVLLCGVVLIVLCSSLVNGNSNATQIPLTPINHDLYHTRGALLEEIETLVHRHPSKLSMETFSTQNKGYHAEMTVVTYCRNKKDCDDKSKLRILLSFGQHGRELITTELALRILSILSEEEFLSSAYPLNLNNTLDRLVIKVIPMENVNGRKLVESGDLCERRNGRGVDLNRNWSVDWGKKEKVCSLDNHLGGAKVVFALSTNLALLYWILCDYDPYEENPGSGPFSEPETQIMRKLCASFEPHIWVNVHSGMEASITFALFMPYDHKNTTPEGLPSQRMRLMLEKLNRFQLKDRCLVGSGGGSVGYLAHGTATDYMYDIARVPMSFTFESVLNNWSAAFFTLFSLGGVQMKELHPNATGSSFEKWVSIDDYLNGYLMERKSRYGKKMENLKERPANCFCCVLVKVFFAALEI